jgi:Domain of unknown function (DUF5011)/HYR domain
MRDVRKSAVWVALLWMGCVSNPSEEVIRTESSRKDPTEELLAKAIAERARITASGEAYRPVERSGISPAAVTTWGEALDVPEAFVEDATYDGPAEASAILINMGVIEPRQGSSFVVLSTGIADTTLPPERGTDFGQAGTTDDVATLTLSLHVPPDATHLAFQYNFLSSESPDFVGGSFNDTFSVEITDGMGAVVTEELASVNTSFFFPVSESRAGGTNYAIYAEEPSGVDIFPPNSTGLPDAGLTDFQFFSTPVRGGDELLLRFQIRDNGDGILDSAVILDALQFVSVETVDPNPTLVNRGGAIDTDDLQSLATGGRSVRGAVADGHSRVLLRMKLPGNLPTTFAFAEPDPANGSLSQVDGSANGTTVDATIIEVDGVHYALAVFHAPNVFEREDHRADDSIESERTIELTATYGRDPSTIRLVLGRRPVVLATGAWSSASDWQRLSLTRESTYSVTYVSLPYSCPVELRQLPIAFDQPSCPDALPAPPPAGQGTVYCSPPDPDLLKNGVNEAITNARRLALAAEQVDLVGHGTAGLAARRHVGSGDYEDLIDALGFGTVNRLITVNTPHYGSLVADKLVEARGVGGAHYLCELRSLFQLQVEEGDVDSITSTELVTRPLPELAVPSHAIFGSGANAVSRRVMKGTRNSLFLAYEQTEVLTGIGSDSDTFPNVVYDFNDHDFFLDLTSQMGGVSTDAATELVFQRAQSDEGTPPADSDYFSSMRDERVSDTLRTLLSEAPDSPVFDTFKAPPPALQRRVALRAARARSVMEVHPTALGTLQIVAPLPGAVVNAGSLITVRVVPSGFVPQEINATIQQSSASKLGSPYELQLRVPKDALGHVRLVATAFDGAGRRAAATDIGVRVITAATLQDLRVLTQDPVLFGAGSRRQLLVQGRYSDGVTRDLSSASLGTEYISVDSSIAAVSADGLVTAGVAGTTTIVVRSGLLQDSVTVTVRGNSLPQAVAKASTAAVCLVPGALAQVDLDASGSFDLEGDALSYVWRRNGVQFATGAAAQVQLPTGTHAIQLIVTDAAGGVSVSWITVTLRADEEGPSIAVLGPDHPVVECGSAYGDAGATASDSCDGDLTSSIATTSNVDASAVGTYQVQYAVEDSAGHVSSAGREVSVQDTTAPVLSCPASTIAECTGSGQAMVTPGTGTATDVCDTVSVVGPVAGSYPLGTTAVSYIATDRAGNQAACASAVTVQDTIVPAIACPPATTAECTANGHATVDPGTAIASDVCTGVTVASPTITSFPLGTTPVSYTATDLSGNQSTCATTVTVQDTTPPVGISDGAPPLSPPDHSYHTVKLSDCNFSVVDACGGTLPPSIHHAQINCVTSDEPDDAPGGDDGDTQNDIIVVDSQTVKLRAEQHSRRNGRLYNIYFKIEDAQGNRVNGVCPVEVLAANCSPGDPSCRPVDSGGKHSVCF